MDELLDGDNFAISCPKCGVKSGHAIRNLKRFGFKCPKCRTAIVNGKFKRDIAKIERNLEKSLQQDGGERGSEE